MNQGLYEELVTKLINFKIDELDKDTFQVKKTSIDKAEAATMIKAIDGKRYNNRTVRMNEADGGFKRAGEESGSGRSDRAEGRKRTYAPREKRNF